MVKAMTKRMNSMQGVIASRKGCPIGNLLVSYRHTLATKGVDRYAETISEGCRSVAMIMMSVGDENTANSAAFGTFLHNGIQISCIINSRINHRCPLSATSKDN